MIFVSRSGKRLGLGLAATLAKAAILHGQRPAGPADGYQAAQHGSTDAAVGVIAAPSAQRNCARVRFCLQTPALRPVDCLYSRPNQQPEA